MSLSSVSTFLDCHQNETSCSFHCSPPRRCYQVFECEEKKGLFYVCNDHDPNILWLFSTLLIVLICCISICCIAGCVYGIIIGLFKIKKSARTVTESNLEVPKLSTTSYTLHPNPNSIKHYDSAYKERKTTL